MNCPFYGHALYPAPDAVAGAIYLARRLSDTLPNMKAPFILMAQDGNQCALIVNAHAPCQMEIESREIDWRTCPRVDAIRSEVKT